jgi:putative ABC transport system permease protein
VAGLLIGWAVAPLVTRPGVGLLGTGASPGLTVSAVAFVVTVALLVAMLGTFIPAVRAARISTIRALAASVRPPKRRALLAALSARLPVPLLLGLRIAGRRLRRTALSVASIAVTVSGIVPVLASQAAINVIFITWSSVHDAMVSSALARALGATPRQVTAGLVAAQVLPAFAGAVLGIPLGIGLSAAIQHRNSHRHVPARRRNPGSPGRDHHRRHRAHHPGGQRRRP